MARPAPLPLSRPVWPRLGVLDPLAFLLEELGTASPATCIVALLPTLNVNCDEGIWKPASGGAPGMFFAKGPSRDTNSEKADGSPVPLVDSHAVLDSRHPNDCLASSNCNTTL